MSTLWPCKLCFLKVVLGHGKLQLAQAFQKLAFKMQWGPQGQPEEFSCRGAKSLPLSDAVSTSSLSSWPNAHEQPLFQLDEDFHHLIFFCILCPPPPFQGPLSCCILSSCLESQKVEWQFQHPLFVFGESKGWVAVSWWGQTCCHKNQTDGGASVVAEQTWMSTLLL